MTPGTIPNNERIVRLLYRKLKGLPLTPSEASVLDGWLNRSPGHRLVFESLSDDQWLADARKRYYAPGKEKGLAELRHELFGDRLYKAWHYTWYSRLLRRVKRQIKIILDFLVPSGKGE